MWIEKRLRDLQRLSLSRHAYGLGWRTAVERFLELTGPRRFSPDEVFLLGLMNPTIAHGDLDRYISKEAMLARQNAVNPKEHHRLTEDKLVFYRHCREHDLPTPTVFGAWVSSVESPVEVPVANSEQAWVDMCRQLPTDDLVLKPVGGVHGQGVMLLRRDGSRFVTHDEQSLDALGLLREMKASGYRDWIFQERLHAHRKIAQFTGSDNLQTARVVTWVDDSRVPHTLFAWLRVIGGSTAFDNFNFGASGNFAATIDISNGTLAYALGSARNGLGLQEVSVHPSSGQPFAGFEIPYGHEIFELTARAAQAFKPLVTVGWDVAITDSGVALIEGNVTWDPLPTRENLGGMIAALSAN